MNTGFLSLLIVALGSATLLKATASAIKYSSEHDTKPETMAEVKRFESPSVRKLLQGLNEDQSSTRRFTPVGYSQATQQLIRTSNTNLVRQREFIKKLRDSIKSNEGRFKINEPQVKGDGSYKVNDKEIEVDMKISVDPNTSPGSSVPSGPPSTAPASSPGAPPTGPASSPGTPSTGPASSPGTPSTGPASSPRTPSTGPASSPAAPSTAPGSPSGTSAAAPVSSPGASTPASGASSKQAQQQVLPMMCLVPCPSQGGCSCSAQTPPQSPPAAAQAPSPALVPIPAPAPTTPPLNHCKQTTEAALEPYMDDILQLHNRYRKIHNAPPLIINKDMSCQASDYSEKIADLGALVNSGYTDRQSHGESLALICNENVKQAAEQATKNWYDEVCSYTFGIDGSQTGTDHFTALVWKNTNQLGIGKAERDEDGKKCIYFVVRYLPSGNIETEKKEFVKNVEKGSFDSSYCSNVRDEGGLDGGYGFRRTSRANRNGF